MTLLLEERLKISKYNMKIVYIIIVIIIVGCNNSSPTIQNVESAKWDVKILEYKAVQQRIYIYSHQWGITGNHEQTIISNEPLNVINDSIRGQKLILYSCDVFYKQVPDSLIIYAAASSILDNRSDERSVINIMVNELKNADEMNYYRKNYQALGLIRSCGH